MIKKLKDRMGSDRADSLISAVFILPVIFFMLITTIDMGIYMSNRGQIQAAARDGARTVAIMGGNGNSSQQTSLMKRYGQDYSICDTVDNSTSATTPVECNVASSLLNSAGLTNVSIDSVNCSPVVNGTKQTFTKAVGERVSCEVKWKYKGLPGSAMTFVRDPALRGQQTTTGSAESEVKLDSLG